MNEHETNLTLLAAWITALISLLSVIATLIGAWWQVRQQWLLNSATLVTSLDDRFNSAEWRAYRQQCQEKLSAFYNGTADLDISENFPVLPFFENLGYLVHTGAIDRMIVWHKFGWFIVAYYLALTSRRNVIVEVRQLEGEKLLWKEFEWLYEACVEIYCKQGVQYDEALHENKVARLLKWESTLEVPPSESSLIAKQ